MGKTIVSLTCSLACPITAFQMNVQIPLCPTSIENNLLVWFSPSSQTILFSLQSNLVTTKISSANIYPKILFLVLNSLTGYGTLVTDLLYLRLVICMKTYFASLMILLAISVWTNLMLHSETPITGPTCVQTWKRPMYHHAQTVSSISHE